MKHYLLAITLLFAVNLLFLQATNAQMDVTTGLCTKYIVPPFISDGQQYKALLNKDEIAEFHATFYAGNTYRIAGASGQKEGKLIFSMYDKERNLLFTNKDYSNTTYWDFKFSSTISCIIEANVDAAKGESTSGIAVMLIGFKQ